MMTIESAMGHKTMGEHVSDFNWISTCFFVWNRQKTCHGNVSYHLSYIDYFLVSIQQRFRPLKLKSTKMFPTSPFLSLV